MYLARAFLNPVSPAVRADLADLASLHRTVMRAFPDDAGLSAREAHGVLHRVDEDARRGRFALLVQSATRPDLARLPAGYFLDLRDDLDLAGSGSHENPAVREVDKERERIRSGDLFAFRLRANTTRKITKLDEATGLPTKNGRRVPVRGDDGRLAWLARHAAKAGFQVGDVRVLELPVRSSRGRGLTLAGASFEGNLRVTDADAFRAALADGIGPGKAFGFGLLSIQRAR
jgi:CRISPR system Cascade subunit CasE